MTKIEIIISIAIAAILAAILFGNTNGGSISYGVNGITEIRCIEGYKFVIGDGGNARQMMDASGQGVRCQ